MGRPVNKRYFGGGPGSQIPVTAFIPGAAEASGYIVKQRGTRKYEVTDGTNVGICRLVNKDLGTLAEGEMVIEATDGTTTWQVTKLQNRTCILEGNMKRPWSLEAPIGDRVQLQPADVAVPVISIDVHPTDQITVGGAATFTVTASSDPVTTLTYQWQVRKGGGSYSDLAGETAATLTLTGMTDAEDGWTYRCVVDAANALPVTSNSARLIFGD